MPPSGKTQWHGLSGHSCRCGVQGPRKLSKLLACAHCEDQPHAPLDWIFGHKKCGWLCRHRREGKAPSLPASASRFAALWGSVCNKPNDISNPKVEGCPMAPSLPTAQLGSQQPLCPAEPWHPGEWKQLQDSGAESSVRGKRGLINLISPTLIKQ